MGSLEVLLIAPEAAPFAKTGGLADVTGSLPPALERLGVRVRLAIPCHRSAWFSGRPIEPAGQSVSVPLGSRSIEGRLLLSTLPGSSVEVCLIDCPEFFDRDGVYQGPGGDYPDNAARYIFFQRAALEAIDRLGWRPDVLHLHDWTTGLVPVYLDELYRPRAGFAGIGTLLTIHNLAYQGSFWPGEMAQTGLDYRLYNWRDLEAYGRLNFLKGGLVRADLIGTVSPSYAREIQEPALGRGLDGLLRNRSADLRGILNGIDTGAWNPANDPHIAARYDAETVVEGKAACKAALQREAGLPVRPGVPVLAQIGRFDPQKGWDLLAGAADVLLRGDVQLIVLGGGEARYQEMLDRLARREPGKLRVFSGFFDDLAHRIEAGADLFLMPSLYEPCGLSQLYSMAYGTVPIVRATGGLADTVVDPDEGGDSATGFRFRGPNPGAFLEAIDRALALRDDPRRWLRMIRAGMLQDWSWDRSARSYVDLYEEVGRRRSARAVG
ncbi:MAG: glycogen synthase GlgA [Isosphaeraceae bacterium]